MSNSDLYTRDFYAWTHEQAALLRRGELAEADLANIAEEIESMGRGERRELTSRLAVLLAHLLKWQVQPELRGHSWRLTIAEQRRQTARILSESPSFRPMPGDMLANAYGDAQLKARRETGLPEADFPAACPWTLDQMLSDDIAP